MKMTFLPIAALLALGACGDAEDAETEVVQIDNVPTATAPAPPNLETGNPQADLNTTSSIDWQAARADLAGSSGADESIAQVQSSGTRPPVPVLLPTGIVVPQSEGGGPVYRPTSDGYFATYPGADYDIVVNGTNQIATVDGQEVTRSDQMVFTATVAGAQVAISRYGADYLIEFECNELAVGSEGCIDEAEALAVAEKLVVVGSR